MRRILASLLTAAAVLCAVPAAGSFAQSGSTAAVGSRVGTGAPVRLTLPNKEGSVRFMVVGDTGTGTAKQHEVAGVMTSYRQVFPFEFALMLGYNMYWGEKADDYKKKFEDVYKPLLVQKVKIYSSLGNYEESNQSLYVHF